MSLPLIRPSFCWFALVFAVCALWATDSRAAPSCGLENWLVELNASANSYVAALGTTSEPEAARRFRTEMERYPRENLVKQIGAADLGANETALNAFIASRHHLLSLHRDNWGEMAKRYGDDPRFQAQSESLSRFLNSVPCDETAVDFLNATERTTPDLIDRLRAGVTDIAKIFSRAEPEELPAPLDPENFDEFRPANRKPPALNEAALVKQSGNIAFVLGIFTFLTAILAWSWLRYGILQRRAIRYPCTLPVVIFDGVTTRLGDLLNLSQLGAKLETDLPLNERQRVKLTIGPVTRTARVVWSNEHFVGLKFEKRLSEAELEELLGPFAASVYAQRAVAEWEEDAQSDRETVAPPSDGSGDAPQDIPPEDKDNAAA